MRYKGKKCFGYHPGLGLWRQHAGRSGQTGILLKYTLNVDEENKVGGKLTVWFRSLLSLLGEPT